MNTNPSKTNSAAISGHSESRALPVAAHTPGPWTPVSNRVYHDFSDGSRFVASCEVHKDYTPFLEQCANARLIAAAPELLARLEETEVLAVELMERAERIDAMLIEAKGGKRDCELGELTRLRGQLSKNRAALAKAKGQP